MCVFKKIRVRRTFRQNLAHAHYLDIVAGQLVNKQTRYIFIGKQLEGFQIISSSIVIPNSHAQATLPTSGA